MKRIVYISLLLLSHAALSDAQNAKFALSTNVLEWGNFGTANLEVGVGLAQHVSLHAGVKYNPWEYSDKRAELPVRNNQTTCFIGARWWLWYVLSGWWVGAKVQYSDYEKTGIWRPAVEDGVKVGGGLSFGYTLMLHKNLNLEFATGIWGGSQVKYDLYCCHKCMNVRETGVRGFIGLDDISIALMFVF